MIQPSDIRSVRAVPLLRGAAVRCILRDGRRLYVIGAPRPMTQHQAAALAREGAAACILRGLRPLPRGLSIYQEG